MHELSLISSLLRRIESVARDASAEKVLRVKVTLGALCHISAEHFREHFVEGTRGTIAEGAELEITEREDASEPHAQDILLESVTVAE